MARTYNPEFAQILSEALARAGIRPQQAGQEHIEDALRSANFLLTEFSNRNVNQYQLVEQVIPTVDGTATYALMEGAIDVWHMVYRRDDSDTPVWPISRSDYHSIPKKDPEGRPTVYFSERGVTGNTPRTVTLWPVPDRVDSIRIWVWCRHDSQTFDTNAPMAIEFLDAYADGLALRLAKKFDPPRVEGLELDYARSFKAATDTARERAPLRLRMRGYTRGRRF